MPKDRPTAVLVDHVNLAQPPVVQMPRDPAEAVLVDRRIVVARTPYDSIITDHPLAPFFAFAFLLDFRI